MSHRAREERKNKPKTIASGKPGARKTHKFQVTGKCGPKHLRPAGVAVKWGITGCRGKPVVEDLNNQGAHGWRQVAPCTRLGSERQKRTGPRRGPYFKGTIHCRKNRGGSLSAEKTRKPSWPLSHFPPKPPVNGWSKKIQPIQMQTKKLCERSEHSTHTKMLHEQKKKALMFPYIYRNFTIKQIKILIQIIA